MSTPSTTGYRAGCDVSHYQGAIDWKTLAGYVEFVYIKATEGENGVDPKFRENWRGAIDAGIAHGAYHFFRPGDQATGGRQGAHFLSVMRDDWGQLPPVVDYEQGCLDADEQTSVRAWLSTVEPRAGTAALYTDRYIYSRLMPILTGWPLWIAAYGPAAPELDWTFWQHTPSGRLPGIPTPVDLDWWRVQPGAPAARS